MCWFQQSTFHSEIQSGRLWNGVPNAGATRFAFHSKKKQRENGNNFFKKNSIQHGPNAKIGPALYFTGARRPANYRHAACKPIDHGSTPVIGPLFIDFRATGQRHGPHTPRLLSTAFEYFAGKEAADPYQYTENNKNYSIAARH